MSTQIARSRGKLLLLWGLLGPVVGFICYTIALSIDAGVRGTYFAWHPFAILHPLVLLMTLAVGFLPALCTGVYFRWVAPRFLSKIGLALHTAFVGGLLAGVLCGVGALVFAFRPDQSTFAAGAFVGFITGALGSFPLAWLSYMLGVVPGNKVASSA